MIHNQYNQKEWTHVFTDGSAENAVRNGGAGFHIQYKNGESINRATPAGKHATSHRAEATALIDAIDALYSERQLGRVIFFCDDMSLLQTLQLN